MTRPVLEIKNLNVDYGLGDQAVRAVRDVNLTLHRGEVLGLAGESGSGKSTLAYGLTRLLPPPGVISGGSVLYHPPSGEPIDIMTLSPAQLRRFRWAETSIVFQGAMNSLNPVHKVSTQLLDVLAAHEPTMSARGPAGPRPRAAQARRHLGRPAGQLPAPALRRHAAARHDRHGARPGAADRHHGRADHRARRGDAAADPRASWSSCANGSASRCCSSRTTCRCWSSSPTGSRSCTADGSSRRRRPPRCTGTRCTRTARGC